MHLIPSIEIQSCTTPKSSVHKARPIYTEVTVHQPDYSSLVGRKRSQVKVWHQVTPLQWYQIDIPAWGIKSRRGHQSMEAGCIRKWYWWGWNTAIPASPVGSHWVWASTKVSSKSQQIDESDIIDTIFEWDARSDDDIWTPCFFSFSMCVSTWEWHIWAYKLLMNDEKMAK